MKKIYILLTGLLMAMGLQAQTVTPSWGVTFDNKSDLDGFTIIDANGDAHMYEGILRGGWSWLSHEEVSGAASYYYDRNNAADDWLITPGLNLKNARTYTVSLDANAANIYPERFEVMMGTAPNVENMTTTLIPPTVTKKGDFEHFSAEFTVVEDGVYYIAIHAISDKGQYILDIKNLAVEPGLLSDAPSAVTDFNITPDPAGLKKATLAFVLPTTLNNGEALSAITKVEINRNGVLVKTLENVSPAEEVTYTDVLPAEGLYTYSVVVYNENGDGAPSIKKVYVGYDAPTPPINPHVVDKFSSIDIVWEQSLGQNGGIIKRSDMSYYIYEIDEDGKVGNRLATVDKGKLLYNIPMDTQSGEQHLITYAMIAGNSQGISERVETKGFLVGKPLTYPFAEHFAEQGIDNFWWVSGKGTGFENQYAGFTTGKSSAEGDEGSLIFEGFFDDDVVALHSSKVSLSGAEHPWLTFYHKAMNGTPVEMKVVAVKPNGETDILNTIDYNEGYADWTRELIDLAPYKDENYVTVEFIYTNHSNEKATLAYLDNIKIGEVADYDVDITFDCVQTVTEGESFAPSITLTNNGTKVLENCVVTIGCETDKLESASNSTAPSKKSVFKHEMNAPFGDAGKQYAVSAAITFPAESGLEARSFEQIVRVQASTIPTVTDVKAYVYADEQKTVLVWNEPKNPSLKVTDDFESYAPFTTSEMGEWNSLDLDKGISEQIFQGYDTPLDDNSFGFAAYNLAYLNPGLLDTNEEFASHSGEQCAASFFCHDGFYNYRDQNNWLISPRLSGKSQKISLYAGNYDSNSPEVFEIMYSTTDANTESFIRLGAERRVADGKWHPFTATLPAGTQYFAIHHYTGADEAYMFKLDDISFEKALTIKSYDIYVNGELVGSTDDTNYTIAAVDTEGEYNVVAHYTDGSVSAPVAAQVSDGIAEITTYADETGKLYNIAGQRIEGAQMRGNIIILNGKKYITNNK